MKLKAVLVGDSGVGKTAVYQRLDHGDFSLACVPTVSGTFRPLKVRVGSQIAEIALWDTAGQERFRTIVPLYFQRAAIILLTFSLVSRESFDHVEDWYEFARNHSPPEAHFFLIGNKSDLMDERDVSFDEAQEKSDRLKGDVYLETSAATGSGCEAVMEAFANYVRSMTKEQAALPGYLIVADGTGFEGGAKRQCC